MIFSSLFFRFQKFRIVVSDDVIQNSAFHVSAHIR